MVATVLSPLIKDRMREREKYIRKCYQKELKPSSRESRWTAEQEPWAFLTQGFQKIGQTFSWCHSGPRSIRWGTGLADHTCHGNTKAREWSPGGIVPPQVLENKGAISKGFFFFFFQKRILIKTRWYLVSLFHQYLNLLCRRRQEPLSPGQHCRTPRALAEQRQAYLALMEPLALASIGEPGSAVSSESSSSGRMSRFC